MAPKKTISITMIMCGCSSQTNQIPLADITRGKRKLFGWYEIYFNQLFIAYSNEIVSECMTVINWYKYFGFAVWPSHLSVGSIGEIKKGVEKWLKWWDFSHHINPILMTVPTLPNQFYVDFLLVVFLLLVFFGYVEGIGGDFLGVTRGLCCCLRIFRVEKVMLLCMTNLWRRWWSWSAEKDREAPNKKWK